MTDDQIAAVHRALRYLASLDEDHAMMKNQVGFSAMDTEEGNHLPALSKLTDVQAARGRLILTK
jgi:hypothetical protein